MRTSIIAALLSLPLVGVATFAAADKEATVDGVLDKYVKAIGGKEAWDRVQSRQIKADLEALGSTSEWTLLAKAPNKRVSKVDLTGIGLVQDGFDGQTAWSKSQAGVRTKEGGELARDKAEAEFRREVRLKELYPNLEVKGTETFNGEEVQVLEAKPSSGGKERFTFSAKSGLLVRRQSEFTGADGNEVGVDAELSDYRDVDGLKYPHDQKFKILVGGQQVFDFALKVKEIKHNPKVEDAEFAKPE